MLADGASIILTYNQDSQGMDVGDVITAAPKTLPLGFGRSKDFAYTTNTTAAIDFVMDVNGGKGPNSETIDNKMKDIRSFKAARFSTGCAGVMIPNIGCFVNLGTSYECIDTCSDTTWDNHGSQNQHCSSNCWAGAKKACNDIGMRMPSKNTLSSFYNSNYPEVPQSGWFWYSSEYVSDLAWSLNFGGGSWFADQKRVRNGVLCVGE